MAVSAGLRPDSQYTTVGTDSEEGRAALNHTGYSDGEEGSLRNVLVSSLPAPPFFSGCKGSWLLEERGGDGHVYLAERISPGSHQTYLIDDPYQALVPRGYGNCMPTHWCLSSATFEQW